MAINIILLFIFIACFIKIILILIKKLPMVANIDLNRIPQEKERQTKRILLERRIKRKINQLKNKILKRGVD